MKKITKKTLILLSCALIFHNQAQANLLWDINQGINLYQQNNLNIAKTFFESYIKNVPNDKDAYFWLGKIHQKLDKNNKKSNDCFKKAYELTTNEKNIEKIDFNIDTTSNIEDYFDMSAMYFEAGNIKESDFYADMMLKINSKSPSAYFIKAKIAHMNKNDEKAKEYLNLAILYNNELLKTNLAKSLNISNIPDATKEMYATFALEAYFRGNLNNAIKYLKKYIEIDKTNNDIISMLVDSYIKNNQLYEAQELITSTLNENPNNIQMLLHQAKLQKKENISVEKTLLKAYEINPNNQQVLLELGNYYLENMDFKNSKQYFETLVNVNDELYEAYFGYIYSLIETGQTKEIIPLIRKATTINKNSSQNYYLLAKLCQKQGNLTEAEEYIKEAILMDENPNYFFELGKINFDLQKPEQAIINLNDAKLSRLNKIFLSEADELLIRSYLKNYDIKNAKKLIDTKINLDKNELMYKYNLYNLLKLQGDNKTAQIYYRQIKKANPASIADYLDLSEINYELKGLDAAIKILDNGIKKYPYESKLYFKKLKLYSMNNQQEKMQEQLLTIEAIFK